MNRRQIAAWCLYDFANSSYSAVIAGTIFARYYTQVIVGNEAGLGDFEGYVKIDPAFVRPAEVDHLIGDASKAERDLGWKPGTSFEELIRLMTRSDLELLARS